MPIIRGRSMKNGRSLTVRLEAAQVDKLETLCEATGLSYAEAIRRLIETAIIAPTVRSALPKGEPLAEPAMT